MNVPTYLQVEITSRCNLKCRMCPLTLGTTLTSGQDANLREASWEEVKRYGQQVGHVLISGFGEPMTDARFMRMLQELDDLGVATSFSTNAIGAEHIAGRLGRLRHLVSANVSVDSPDDSLYHEIRGGDLQRVWKGLRALADSLKGRVSVSSVAMASNLESLRAFPPILAEMGVRTYVLQPMVDWHPQLGSEHLHKHSWESNLVEQIKADCASRDILCIVTPKTDMEFTAPSEMLVQFHAGRVANLRETKPCVVPFESIYVDSSGQVFPCCHSAGHSPLGSLQRNTLEEIVNGPSLRRFQEDLLDARTTPAVCRACNVVPLGPHPFKSYRARIVQLTRDRLKYRLVAQNVGTVAWDKDREIRISASQPRDRISSLHHPTWINGGRVARAEETTVPPGHFATFEFTISEAAKNNRIEWFQLLVEDHAWLPDTFFRLPDPFELSPSEHCRSAEPALR